MPVSAKTITKNPMEEQMDHHSGQAEKFRQEQQVKDKARGELLTKNIGAVMKNDEILTCVKLDNVVYWKRAKLSKDYKDLNNTWDALRRGLIMRLKNIGYFSQKEEGANA